MNLTYPFDIEQLQYQAIVQWLWLYVLLAEVPPPVLHHCFSPFAPQWLFYKSILDPVIYFYSVVTKINMKVGRRTQLLLSGQSISQYTLYSLIFNVLLSIIIYKQRA